MRASIPRRVPLAGLIVACVLVALAAGYGRRVWIRGFFGDGPERVPASSTSAATSPPLAPVRVLLIDGLRADFADGLPELARACDGGERLTVDVGFPTVSLPVQHVLWTGRTQQESGVLYRIPRLEAAPADALPALVPGSSAVAESHVDIIHSFGFTRSVPASEDEVDEAWRREGFFASAREAVASEAPLVFVHALRVDEAGHAEGASSVRYREAAESIDAALPGWLAERPDATWYVTADHGHRDGGGHGGSDEDLRRVRACRFGAGVTATTEIRALSLPAFANELRSVLGVAPTRVNEPVELPGPGGARWFGAAVLWALGLGLVLRQRVSVGLFSLFASALGFVLIEGWPSLSIPAVYPPLGRDAAVFGLAGPLLLALVALRREGGEDHPHDRWLLGALAPGVAFALGAHVLAGTPAWLFGGAPPLTPAWTAWASVSSVWLAAGAATLAFALALRGLLDALARRRKSS